MLQQLLLRSAASSCDSLQGIARGLNIANSQSLFNEGFMQRELNYMRHHQ